jgi:pimeloyl-ACP methyl ester carboxylesterase
MDLFYRELGEGEPLVILHGLYGMSDNWLSVGKQLSQQFRVILVDQRNHGQSPFAGSHTYPDLVNDLTDLLERLGIARAHLLGHSMGGKAAMLFTHQHPGRVARLVVVDISPWGYSADGSHSEAILREHSRIIAGLRSIPLRKISSRREAETILAQSVADNRTALFFLKNLRRGKDGSFSWAINLDAIEKNFDSIMGNVFPLKLAKPILAHTLFIKGLNSGYLSDSSVMHLKELFPLSHFVGIENAGHWVHAEQPAAFVEAVLSFLGGGATSP